MRRSLMTTPIGGRENGARGGGTGAHSRLLAPIRPSGTLQSERYSTRAVVVDKSAEENPFSCGDILPVEKLVERMRHDKTRRLVADIMHHRGGISASNVAAGSSTDSPPSQPTVVAVQSSGSNQTVHAQKDASASNRGILGVGKLQPISDVDISRYLHRLRGASNHHHSRQHGSRVGSPTMSEVRCGSRGGSPRLRELISSRNSLSHTTVDGGASFMSRPASPSSNESHETTNTTALGITRPAFLDNLPKAHYIARAYLKYAGEHGTGHWILRSDVLQDMETSERERDKGRHDVSQLPRDMRHFVRVCGVETSMTQEERNEIEATSFRAKKQMEVTAIQQKAYQQSMNTVQQFLRDVVGIQHVGSAPQGGAQVYEALENAALRRPPGTSGTGVTTANATNRRAGGHPAAATVTFTSASGECTTGSKAAGGASALSKPPPISPSTPSMLDSTSRRRLSPPPTAPGCSGGDLPRVEWIDVHVMQADVCLKWAVLLWTHLAHGLLCHADVMMSTPASGHRAADGRRAVQRDVAAQIRIPVAWISWFANTFPAWFPTTCRCALSLADVHQADVSPALPSPMWASLSGSAVDETSAMGSMLPSPVASPSPRSVDLPLVAWATKALSYTTAFSTTCCTGKCPVHVTDERIEELLQRRLVEGALCDRSAPPALTQKPGNDHLHAGTSSPQRYSQTKPSGASSKTQPNMTPALHALLDLPTQQLNLRRRLEALMSSQPQATIRENNLPRVAATAARWMVGQPKLRHFTVKALCEGLPYSSPSFLASRSWFLWIPESGRLLARLTRDGVHAQPPQTPLLSSVSSGRFAILQPMLRTYAALTRRNAADCDDDTFLSRLLEADLSELRHSAQSHGASPDSSKSLLPDAAAWNRRAPRHENWLLCSTVEEAFLYYYARRKERRELMAMIHSADQQHLHSGKQLTGAPGLGVERSHAGEDTAASAELDVSSSPVDGDDRGSDADPEELEFLRQEDLKRKAVEDAAQQSRSVAAIREYFCAWDRDGDSAWSFFEFCTASWNAAEQYLSVSMSVGGIQPLEDNGVAAGVERTGRQGRDALNLMVWEFFFVFTTALFPMPPPGLPSDHMRSDILSLRRQRERAVEHSWRDCKQLHDFVIRECDVFGFTVAM